MTQLYTFKLFSFFTESRFLICFVFLPIFIYAQPVSQTFNASGTYTIPNGYSANINVQVWGAGGGGGTNVNDRSGGGGGGAFAFRIYTNVTSGSFTVTVGGGGAAGAAGGLSSFSRATFTTTTAAGGGASGGTAGGAGGTTAASSGLYTRAGGSGGAGSNNGGGGGGGGSATTKAAGSNGTTATNNNGGAGGAGQGAGGRGADDADATAPVDDALAGNTPGGGGGGKAEGNGTSKSGANGRVIVTVTFYWESTKTLATIGGGGSAAETGCSALTTGVISTSVIMVPAGSNLTYRIGANAGEPVCSDNGGTAPFEAEEGIGLFASATSGGTQVYDSRLFTGAGPSDDPSNILPTGSGCIYNNNATSKYLTIKTIDATNNTASLTSQDEEVAYIAYEVISGNSGCINLPIQLTSFDVRLLHNTPLVEWTTMSELNNAYYSLERSSNGSDFKEITRIYGHGTTDRQNHYSYTDYNASNGLNYYRLTQVDLNGNYTTYHTISVFVPVEDFSVFPTFFSQEVTLQMPLPYDKPAAWVLYDAFGKTIRAGVLRSQPIQQIALPGIQTGTYILTIVFEEGLKSHKLIKL
ncbi:MAG: T9SS type A sorting domain-containing protein [Saprospiraceae bacterium]|nr:T9SS type A sorting domain-containing protein [Saprospiraceae bacterium]